MCPFFLIYYYILPFLRDMMFNSPETPKYAGRALCSQLSTSDNIKRTEKISKEAWLTVFVDVEVADVGGDHEL